MDQAIADGVSEADLNSHVGKSNATLCTRFYTYGEYGLDVLGVSDGNGNYPYTGISPYSLPHYPDDPADTVYNFGWNYT